MELLLLGIALLLLVAPGLLFACLVVPQAVVNRAALVGGYGLLAGLVSVPVVIRIVHYLGLPVSFDFTGVGVVVLFLVLLVYRFYRVAPTFNDTHTGPVPDSLPSHDKILLVLLLGIIIFRLVVLGMELAWRPLFPWDATMHWATKSRVWFEHDELLPFVENRLWLDLRGEGAYTDHHPDYPMTIPLLQLWINSAIGRWDESLMNLPWLICVVGLGAAFYGQARQAGVGTVISLIFTYLLLSLPLLNTHVALAGLADLFLGACYCLAIMAFYNWSVHRQPWQAVLWVFFALSCTLIKNEGFYWLLTFFPALIVVLLPGKKAFGILSILLLAAIVVLVALPRELAVAGHSLGQLNMHYRPGALKAVFESFFLRDSWHMFAYMLTGLIVLALWRARAELQGYAGIATALVSAACLFLILFLFTRYAVGAIRFTAVGRISLQLVPAFMFLCVLLYHKVISREQLDLCESTAIDTVRLADDE